MAGLLRAWDPSFQLEAQLLGMACKLFPPGGPDTAPESEEPKETPEVVDGDELELVWRRRWTGRTGRTGRRWWTMTSWLSARWWMGCRMTSCPRSTATDQTGWEV